MRFLADESCDFAAVRALRAAGHDVVAVAEVAGGAEDSAVVELALVELVAAHGDALLGAFAVVEPGRVRISK